MKRTPTVNEALGSSKSQLSSTLLKGLRQTWAEINLENLAHNFHIMRKAVGEGIAIMPAVKADAYGHGAIVCAKVLEQAGADWFGVALPEEGQQLRDAGITRPILCLGGFWEGQEQTLIANRLTPALSNLESLSLLNLAAASAGLEVAYHLKVDTGMGRLGVFHAQLSSFLDALEGFQSLRLDGVLTHLASADLPDKSEFTQDQMEKFSSSVEAVRARGYKPTWVHQANSALAHADPRALGNMVRLGGVMYGLWRDSTNRSLQPLDWKPVMSLRTQVVLLKAVPKGTAIGYGSTFVTDRPSLIATLPIGYADGLPRKLSNRGKVLIRECLAPIVGRISMDLTTADVTDVADVELWDEVTIIGAQGTHEITAEEIAGQVGTISYEITCGISRRVPRIYVGKEIVG